MIFYEMFIKNKPLTLLLLLLKYQGFTFCSSLVIEFSLKHFLSEHLFWKYWSSKFGLRIMDEHPVTHIYTFMSHLWTGELNSALYKYKIISPVTLNTYRCACMEKIRVFNYLTVLTHKIAGCAYTTWDSKRQFRIYMFDVLKWAFWKLHFRDITV